ncbi:MAG: histone deacetylase family protein, partial [Planctomycetota bacterium]
MAAADLMKQPLRRFAVPGALAALLAGCVPASFLQVQVPRAGRAFNDRVAVVYSRHYQINLGGFERMHSFDIHKYARIYLQLQLDGQLRPGDVFVPGPVTREEALRVHTPEFLDSLKSSAAVARCLEVPAIRLLPGFLADAAILSPFRYATGGTVLAGRLAAKHGVAVNLAGGYNHARPDSGGGFNVYADVPIAIRVLQHEGLIKRAMIVDLDVHQGDGPAVCFAGDESVFTFSIHQGDIYPHPKAATDLDVELPAGTGDREYLTALRRHWPSALDRFRPDIVFLVAGCDVLADDPLAGMRLSPEGVVARDADVIDACVARRIPVA